MESIRSQKARIRQFKSTDEVILLKISGDWTIEAFRDAAGMPASTLFGIFLVPALYYALQTFSEKGTAWRTRRRDRTAS